jgi:hypothetical protein
MENQFSFSQIQAALTTAQSALIILPEEPNKDMVAAALSWGLALNKAGKKASVVCSGEMMVEYSDLVGVDKVSQKLAGKILTIAFDIEDSTQKVSYNVENNKLKIFIEPKEGFPPISTDKIEYSYGGGQADLVFLIGVKDWEQLGKIYQDNQNFFKKAKTINFELNDSHFQAASWSELISLLLANLKLPTDADMATNLLAGMEEATKNFSSPQAGAGTFEAAAFCLRNGGQRSRRKMNLRPMSTEISAQKPPEEVKKPSPDWLTPKIYKGNTLV